MKSDAQKDPEVFPDALRARVLVNQVNFTIITVSSHVTEKKIFDNSNIGGPYVKT